MLSPVELAALILSTAGPGVDPLEPVLGPGERFAMLLERIDELSIERHDFGGSANALLAGFIRRIDRLKAHLIGAEDYARWAARLVDAGGPVSDGEVEREFAEVYRVHERMLAEAGARDAGDLIRDALRVVRERPALARRFEHVLVDDAHELDLASATLTRAVAGSRLTAAADPARTSGGVRQEAFGEVITLEQSLRLPRRVHRAASAAVSCACEPTAAEGEVEFWRCANERAQAQSAAADIERLIVGEGVPPGQIAVLVPAISREGQAVAVALEERAVPHRLVGEAAFFSAPRSATCSRGCGCWPTPPTRRGRPCAGASADRAALGRHRPLHADRAPAQARHGRRARGRDRVAAGAARGARADPRLPQAVPIGDVDDRHDSARPVRAPADRPARAAPPAAVRRPGRRGAAPAGARAVRRARRRLRPPRAAGDAARVRALHRRGRRLRPARARGARLLRPQVVQVVALDGAGALEAEHVYVLGLHAGLSAPAPEPIPLAPAARRRMRTASGPGGRAAGCDGAGSRAPVVRQALYVAVTRARRRVVLAYPSASDRSAALAPAPVVDAMRRAVGGAWEDREEELFGPAETLHSTYRLLRDEVLEGTMRAGGRLGELRLDTDLDVSHAVVRYLELLKLAALIARPEGQSLAEALRDVNARILQAVTAEQREISPRRRSTTICSTPSATPAGGRRRSPRATSRRWSRSCPRAATGSCCRRRTSTRTGRAR